MSSESENQNAEGTENPSEQLQRAIFNAIPEQIAVVDRKGVILRTNAAWKHFMNSPMAAIGAIDGASNYLKACREQTGRDTRSLREAADGVESVLSGSVGHFQAQYCRPGAPEGGRWFALTATPLPGGGAVLIHEDVTARRRMELEILGISEYERRQLGRELHDGLCQVLGGMVLSIAVLAGSLKKRGVPEGEEMAHLVEVAKSATQQARELSRSLHPVELDRQGLAAALQELTERHDGEVRCEFYCPREVSVSDGMIAVSIYRIGQEAVVNALRHAEPRLVRVSLLERHGCIVLRVEDDGKGFVGADANPELGMGLRIMEYRAGAVGARLKVRSTPGGGTRVSCILPQTEEA